MTPSQHAKVLEALELAQPARCGQSDELYAQEAALIRGAISIMRAVQVGEDRLFGPWKFGNEYRPFHPQASHVRPDYRDGWNDCFKAANASAPPTEHEVKHADQA